MLLYIVFSTLFSISLLYISLDHLLFILIYFFLIFNQILPLFLSTSFYIDSPFSIAISHSHSLICSVPYSLTSLYLYPSFVFIPSKSTILHLTDSRFTLLYHQSLIFHKPLFLFHSQRHSLIPTNYLYCHIIVHISLYRSPITQMLYPNGIHSQPRRLNTTLRNDTIVNA